MHRVVLTVLLFAALMSLCGGAVRAMPAMPCDGGDACRAPEHACLTTAVALPARLAPQPRTPSLPPTPAAGTAAPIPRPVAIAVELPGERAAQRVYLVTARLRR